MKDKSGMNLYYDYLDNEFAELSLEEIGALCMLIQKYTVEHETEHETIDFV